MIVTRAHLHSSTLQDWRHTHTFTQNPKEIEVATSLCAHRVLLRALSSSGVVGELVLRAARVGRSTPRTGFGERTGFPAPSRRRRRGEIVDTWGRERGMADAPSHQRGLGTTPTPANPRTGTLEQELSLPHHTVMYKRKKKPRTLLVRPVL